MRARYRVRLAVNLVNGSTMAGLVIARAGYARLARAPDGLLTGTGYRLPVPAVPAFTMGSVVLTRRDTLPPDTALFRHEARHATQYAWCGGLLMLPLYFTAAGVSWLLCGDVGAWNVFERRAGLADGGYASHQLRPAFQRRAPGSSKAAWQAVAAGDRGLGPEQAGHAGSTASTSP